MPEIKTIDLPHVTPVIDKSTRRKLSAHSLEEKQVVIHCQFDGVPWKYQKIRIWKSTFLYPRNSSKKCKLVHAHNIAIAPKWTIVPDSRGAQFTLVFSGLPAGCSFFDLVEEIPEPDGFMVRNIERNESDVYSISI